MLTKHSDLTCEYGCLTVASSLCCGKRSRPVKEVPCQHWQLRSLFLAPLVVNKGKQVAAVYRELDLRIDSKLFDTVLFDFRV